MQRIAIIIIATFYPNSPTTKVSSALTAHHRRSVSHLPETTENERRGASGHCNFQSEFLIRTSP